VDQRYGKSPQSSQPPSKPNENREGGNQWKGYAFLVFRDKEEAEEALKLFDGLDAVDYGWTMRVRWADEQHQGQSKKGRKLAARLLAGADPPLGEQLCPSNLRGEELRDALRRHFVATGLVDLDPQEDAWVGFEAIKAFYRKHPRQERHACGIQVPENIRTALLEELRATRWPPVPDRTGMQSEEYLVLHRNKSNDGFGVLMALCESLLQWADPLFSFNRVAVTKDFQGSPHTDSSDTTFQYLVSLGSFSEGGQLCMESEIASEIMVIDTHNKMVRADGRFAHWVRGHGGGDRFSLAYFCTNPACSMQQTMAHYSDFRPAREISSCIAGASGRV